MPNCQAVATFYLVVRMALTKKRVVVCRKHLDMAQGLHDAKLTKIIEYGRLSKDWTVYPGGVES